MRYIREVLLGSILTVVVSCGLMLKSENTEKPYPLESAVGFHVGPAIYQDNRQSLFIWTTKGFHTACNRIDGTLWYHIPSRQVKCSVDKLVDLNGACSAIYTVAFDEWPFPDLPPGRYAFELKLNYNMGFAVQDHYTIDAISSDSLVVTPVKADSSAYYNGEIDWLW